MPMTMQRARRNLAVLVAAQALLGAQMSMIFIVGGLSGQMLSPNPCIATLPLSMIILGSALSARPLAAFMRRHGRRAGFLLACSAGALGAAVAAYGLMSGNFWLFMLSGLLTGIYMAAQGFYRFAATDCAPPEFQSRAISWVMAGGLAAAITGPTLVRLTADLTAVPFLATYAAIILALNVWLGSVGQFMGLVLMVLQLVTAGGTFPWQTLPTPLTALHHVLPMGYVVDAMRQLMYGGDLSRVGADVGVLLMWLVGALALAAIGVTWMTHRRTLRDLQPSLIG